MPTKLLYNKKYKILENNITNILFAVDNIINYYIIAKYFHLVLKDDNKANIYCDKLFDIISQSDIFINDSVENYGKAKTINKVISKLYEFGDFKYGSQEDVDYLKETLNRELNTKVDIPNEIANLIIFNCSILFPTFATILSHPNGIILFTKIFKSIIFSD